MSTTKAQPNRTKATYTWVTRCTPAWSVCIVAVLLVFAFIIKPFGKGEAGRHHGEATPWQLVLSVYTVVLHIISIMFPARVCYALGNVMKKMKESALIKDTPKKRKTQTVKTEKGTVTYPLPLFAIILPAYKEDMATMEETLRVLASHPQARHSYHVGDRVALLQGV